MSSEWQTRTFGDLVEFVAEKGKVENTTIQKYISTENMEQNFGGVGLARTIPTSGSVTNFRVADTLFSNIRTYFKKVWQARFDGTCSNDVLVFRTKNPDLLHPDYLHHICRWEKFTEFSVRTSKGAKMPRGDKAALSQFQFELPSLHEQIAISEVLLGLDNRIALLRETNTTLEAIAKALFKSWFVDFDPVHANAGTQAPSLPAEIQALFPSRLVESPQGLIPEGWSWKRLDEAYEINPKRQLKKGFLAKYLDMASVKTQGHVTADVTEREFGSGTKFCNGDTLLARITPCLENGKTAFVDFLDSDEIGWGSTEFVVLKPKAPFPEFHGYLLARQSIFRDFAIQSMSGTSGRQRVQNDVLGSFSIAIPNEQVANAFSQVVTPIQQSISANHKQGQILANLRDTLLPRLISGQLRLPDAEAALAEIGTRSS